MLEYELFSVSFLLDFPPELLNIQTLIYTSEQIKPDLSYKRVRCSFKSRLQQ